MLKPKVGNVPYRDCGTHVEGRFAEFLKLTGVCGVDGSCGKNSRLPGNRTVGAGCRTTILRGRDISDDVIQEKAWMASKVLGRQTVPRAEIWAVSMVLLVWGGTYDLTIITDASYTDQGMDDIARRKNSRGPKRDIWRLIYAELDSKPGGGILSVVKVKSHIDGGQAYCRNTPFRHIVVNELVDFAADRYSDHAGSGKTEKAKFYASQALLGHVCKRIAVVEATLREYATDISQVATDINTAGEVLGEQRRQRIRELRDSGVKRLTGKYGHTVVFVPYENPATCKKRLAAALNDMPRPDACMRCGPGSGVYRCSKCLKRSQGGTNGFLGVGCNMNDPLSTLPNLKGDGTYSNLQAHADDDSDDGLDEAEAAITTAGIAGWGASQPNISMARTTSISGPLPATQDVPAEEEADLSGNEIAYREVVRDCDIALAIRGPLWNPPAPTHDESCTFFEAIDGDGDTIMQGMPSVGRPKSLPAHPIFLLLGPQPPFEIEKAGYRHRLVGAARRTSQMRKLRPSARSRRRFRRISPTRLLLRSPLT